MYMLEQKKHVEHKKTNGLGQTLSTQSSGGPVPHLLVPDAVVDEDEDAVESVEDTEGSSDGQRWTVKEEESQSPCQHHQEQQGDGTSQPGPAGGADTIEVSNFGKEPQIPLRIDEELATNFTKQEEAVKNKYMHNNTPCQPMQTALNYKVRNLNSHHASNCTATVQDSRMSSGKAGRWGEGMVGWRDDATGKQYLQEFKRSSDRQVCGTD
ncbi:hypothetical protein E2C01_028837 [Portunus trituberculatus]|uniref:Uncharacterized protein n=1 Tax=Portunus trituberculatus TaxID=210409 RepID=A0A5B7EPT1_PORTR|nr:hypothetical protein [Portunus trituberculatus]